MKLWKLSLCAVLLTGMLVKAAPVPPPLTPNAFTSTKAADVYEAFYGMATRNLNWVLDKFANGKRFQEGSPEEQCLTQELMKWDIRGIGQFFKGGTYSQENLDEVKRFLEGDNDRCTPDNQALVVFKSFQASLPPAKQKALLEVLREKLEGVKARPLGPGEVAALIAAALVTAPVWAVP